MDDLENLAAGIDFVDRLLERLAQATRHVYTLEQLADGWQRLAVMRQIVIRRRQALARAARQPHPKPPGAEADEVQEPSEAQEGEPDEPGDADEP